MAVSFTSEGWKEIYNLMGDIMESGSKLADKNPSGKHEEEFLRARNSLTALMFAVSATHTSMNPNLN